MHAVVTRHAVRASCREGKDRIPSRILPAMPAIRSVLTARRQSAAITLTISVRRAMLTSRAAAHAAVREQPVQPLKKSKKVVDKE